MSENDSGKHTTTRIEVIDAVGSMFNNGALSKSQLVAAAEMANSPAGVVSVLRLLPDGQYHRPSDMWTALPSIPIES